MNWYRVGYKMDAYYTCIVEAENEDEARRKVLDGEYEDSSFDMGENTEITFCEEDS